jgi:hypothetical protein
MISPFNALAISIARWVLPDAVGPISVITGHGSETGSEQDVDINKLAFGGYHPGPALYRTVASRRNVALSFKIRIADGTRRRCSFIYSLEQASGETATWAVRTLFCTCYSGLLISSCRTCRDWPMTLCCHPFFYDENAFK